MPSEDLDAVDAERGQFLPGVWSPKTGRFEIVLDTFDDVDELRDAHGTETFALELVAVGASTGFTVPSDVRNYHDLSSDDDVLLQAAGDRFTVDLSADSRAVA
ncbi:hypothetical protein VB773_14205 [Haloarculaceae archaeon H-GB2-1]|nr:hypothetical protein [Haloarculaceae archaeon H-GB1-1]MEA5408608.1 hypothetical protein [Haloarculaceae archaeon H-GB2-1]